ncbi:093R [Invertebrate iridescent virus Kaz2018]|nr:093R [Invertebrate iridescent virus Kaz2018]
MSLLDKLFARNHETFYNKIHIYTCTCIFIIIRQIRIFVISI